MASSRTKKKRIQAALVVVLCLALVLAVAAAACYGLLARRLKTLQAGAGVTFGVSRM